MAIRVCGVNKLVLMESSTYRNNTYLLQKLMQQAKINSYEELAEMAGVPRRHIYRLLHGLVLQTRTDVLLKLAQALRISLSELVRAFSAQSPSLQDAEDLAALRQEYDRLQEKMQQQRESLTAEFQRETLDVLESWLTYWPSAAAKAQSNPEIPATRLLPIVKPIEELLAKWGVEAIASVGEEIPYDPQEHQLIKGKAQPGDLVKVNYIGYKQGDKLLYRAKVSAIAS